MSSFGTRRDSGVELWETLTIVIVTSSKQSPISSSANPKVMLANESRAAEAFTAPVL